ncbi:MAG: hypothetical protein MPW15_07270 [Candidatus Manganitrophus sp.]|nr:hypothetical protein [Candidatus Manganitrophus sp.]
MSRAEGIDETVRRGGGAPGRGGPLNRRLLVTAFRARGPPAAQGAQALWMPGAGIRII